MAIFGNIFGKDNQPGPQVLLAWPVKPVDESSKSYMFVLQRAWLVRQAVDDIDRGCGMDYR